MLERVLETEIYRDHTQVSSPELVNLIDELPELIRSGQDLAKLFLQLTKVPIYSIAPKKDGKLWLVAQPVENVDLLLEFRVGTPLYIGNAPSSYLSTIGLRYLEESSRRFGPTRVGELNAVDFTDLSRGVPDWTIDIQSLRPFPGDSDQPKREAMIWIGEKIMPAYVGSMKK